MLDASGLLERLAVLPRLTTEEARAQALREFVLPRMKACGWEERFRSEISDWGQPKQKAAFKDCANGCHRTGAVIAILGPRGLGKTTITAQIALRRAWAEWRNHQTPGPQPVLSTPYRKLVDLLGRYKPLYGDFGTVNQEMLTYSRDVFCAEHDLVVIDEVHECQDQKLAYRILTDIIDRRYSARNDTILIANVDTAGFRKTMSDSILSRLGEHGMIIECGWKSWRVK